MFKKLKQTPDPVVDWETENPAIEEEEEQEYEDEEEEADVPPQPPRRGKKPQARPSQPTVPTPSQYMDMIQGDLNRAHTMINEMRSLYKI
jgi:hypothetical protein